MIIDEFLTLLKDEQYKFYRERGIDGGKSTTE